MHTKSESRGPCTPLPLIATGPQNAGTLLCSWGFLGSPREKTCGIPLSS